MSFEFKTVFARKLLENDPHSNIHQNACSRMVDFATCDNPVSHAFFAGTFNPGKSENDSTFGYDFAEMFKLGWPRSRLVRAIISI